jgi:hypothetical protein
VLPLVIVSREIARARRGAPALASSSDHRQPARS